jgi:hypothetical protein
MTKYKLITLSFPQDPLWVLHDKHGDDVFYMHAIYYDYYWYLQIIYDRLKNDYNDYKSGLTQASEIFKSSGTGSHMLPITEKLANIAKSIQLDTESYILFTRILLDKVAVLVELLINHPNKHELHHSFSDHKKYFIKYRRYNPKYSHLLDGMYWYDQYFLVIRDKVLQHGNQRHSWLKPTPDDLIHILMGKNWGQLTAKNKSGLERIVKKYSPQYSQDVGNIEALPLSDVPVLIHKILLENDRMVENDLPVLYRIVQNTGSAVRVPPLAEKLNRFLSNIASIFQ